MSLKAPAYETVEEADRRLSGCIVLYDGEPVYITRVRQVGTDPEDKGNIYRVYAHPLPYRPKGALDEANNEKMLRKYISSKKFDMTPFKLGYVNTKHGAFWLNRFPARIGKQGLCAQNLKTTGVGPIHHHTGLTFEHLVAGTEFNDMYHNKYPGFGEAVKKLEAGAPSVALSREYALVTEGDEDGLGLRYLVRNGDSKCALLIGNDRISLPMKYKFLGQELQEANIPFVEM